MITVVHTIDDLERDLSRNAAQVDGEIAVMAERSVDRGLKLAQGFARANAGPHGTAFWKRITSEMTSATSGEYGPEGAPKSEFVGVGYRHGGPNMDLPNSADIVVVEMVEEAQRLYDRLFW